MRILIGYDGSDFANAAIDDLARAGLGDDVEARVMCVADVWPHLVDQPRDAEGEANMPQLTALSQRARDQAAKVLAEAQRTAEQGAARAAQQFARWKVNAAAAAGTPWVAMVGEARTWGADLIVVGSQGRGMVGRVLLGSVSQGVVMNASCSVRVARKRKDADATSTQPPKLVLGLDGSPHSAAALNAVSLRHWPAGTEVRVVVAMDIRLATALPTMAHEFSWPVPINQEAQDWPVHAADAAAKELQRAGVSARPLVVEGDPKRVLLGEAEKWPADCIFVGARGLGRLEGVLLGSVSSAVAARAPCSVEVVRFE